MRNKRTRLTKRTRNCIGLNMCFFGIAFNLSDSNIPIICWRCRTSYPIPSYMRVDGKYEGRVYCERCKNNVKDKRAEFVLQMSSI